MIGKLKGIIDSYGDDFVILGVGGVGYQVQCSARTLQELPASGQQTPEALGTYQKAEIDKWRPIIRAAGIKVD